MFNIFKSGFITFFRRRSIEIDCVVFRLHSRFTVALILLFCVIAFSNQFIKSPIICRSNDLYDRDILNPYCWSRSLTRWKVDYSPDAEEIKIHRYYQWAVFFMFFQAILFYIPRWLWRDWEGGKLEWLKNNMGTGPLPEEDTLTAIQPMVQYLYGNRNCHTWWASGYFLCEFLSLLNVLGQMCLMNVFMDGVFWSYGTEVVRFMERDPETRDDPLYFTFPSVAKCKFMSPGPSGLTQRRDVMCALPLNVFTESIYVFLWFWFFILLVLSIFSLIIRISILLSFRVKVFFLRLRFISIRYEVINIIAGNLKASDLFLLYLLGKNLDSAIFRDIMNRLAQKFGYFRESTIELTQMDLHA